MTDIEFYDSLCCTFDLYISQLSIVGANKYFNMTDFNKDWVYQKECGLPLKDIDNSNYIFAQMCYHAQNGGFLVNIIKFKDNQKILKLLFCDYNPCDFVKKYEKYSYSDIAEDFYNHGIVWNKTKTKNPSNGLMVTYCECIYNCAKYLCDLEKTNLGSGITLREAMLNDLISHGNYKNIIKYFRKDIAKKGYGIKLVCDFLKEFHSTFNYLIKPDLHLMRILGLHLGKKYKENEKGYYECIEDSFIVLANINKALIARGDNPITNYHLDRLIYLIGSGNFFLDNKKIK